MNTRALIVVLAGLMLAILAQNPQAAAQMSLGTVSVQGSQSCGGWGFDPPNLTIGTPGMTCYAATLNGCSGTDSLQFVYGVETPSGTLNGTIVFFSGDGGDHAADGQDKLTLIESYVAAGYQVVQVAWGAGTQGSDGQDWEITNTNGGSHPASILNAACRCGSRGCRTRTFGLVRKHVINLLLICASHCAAAAL